MLLAPLIACAQPAMLEIHPDQPKQVLDGMGCGLIFYERHVTSLAEKGRLEKQEALYDTMFKDVRTDFLNLMIRHDHEPANDNADPYLPAYNVKDFAYAGHTVAVCKAARERNPKIRFIATLYTPPIWMKTNNAVSAGGRERASIKPGMELELAEYCWAFLAFMQKNGVAVEFLSICNEPDWPHEQPGYCLTSDQHARLVSKVAGYLDTMASRFPNVPRAGIVGPNTLSAVSCAETWLPAADAFDKGSIDIIGTHDYDRRGERFTGLRKAAGERPVWITEWCVNGKDESPDLLRSASEYWLVMTEAFQQGANAWLAYDWVYPPRQGGEALIHLDWGKGYHLTRIYQGFRQWCAPLSPGMRVVGISLSGKDVSGISKPGIKAAAFISKDGNRLVVHVANVQDKGTSLVIHPGDAFSTSSMTRVRTSATEDAVTLPRPEVRSLIDPVDLPPRTLNTWVFTRE